MGYQIKYQELFFYSCFFRFRDGVPLNSIVAVISAVLFIQFVLWGYSCGRYLLIRQMLENNLRELFGKGTIPEDYKEIFIKFIFIPVSPFTSIYEAGKKGGPCLSKIINWVGIILMSVIMSISSFVTLYFLYKYIFGVSLIGLLVLVVSIYGLLYMPFFRFEKFKDYKRVIGVMAAIHVVVLITGFSFKLLP